jgi:hypothetical protein
MLMSTVPGEGQLVVEATFIKEVGNVTPFDTESTVVENPPVSFMGVPL